VDERKRIELPREISKTKSITNSTKDTEDESNKSDKKVFRSIKSWFNTQPTRVAEDYNYGR
jgi:hypothetical protein